MYYLINRAYIDLIKSASEAGRNFAESSITACKCLWFCIEKLELFPRHKFDVELIKSASEMGSQQGTVRGKLCLILIKISNSYNIDDIRYLFTI